MILSSITMSSFYLTCVHEISFHFSSIVIQSTSTSAHSTKMRALPYCCSALFLAILFKFSFSSLSRVCRELEKEEEKHKFHALRHCQRSNKTVIAYGDADNEEQCADFARLSRALAFNFSPKHRRLVNHYEVKTNETEKTQQNDFYSCEALACPEYRNFSTLVNDTRFDYYSLYAYPTRENCPL